MLLKSLFITVFMSLTGVSLVGCANEPYSNSNGYNVSSYNDEQFGGDNNRQDEERGHSNHKGGGIHR